MVVDEELKMMCDICHEGGQVLGPFLKPMTHLVHTEYLLAGRTRSDVRDVLRDTMYAATVTGSPVENACRLIKQYESEGRGYYGAALALIGRDAQGHPTADSPIVIRSADVSPAGELRVTAGATLVRDSDPDYEVAETHAKAGGILSAFGLVPAASGAPESVAELTRDEDVLIALASRNQRLSRFWLTDQSGAAPLRGAQGPVGGRARRRGRLREHAEPRVLRARHDDDGGAPRGLPARRPRRPRPGRRRSRARATRATAAHPKIAAYRHAVDALLASDQPFLAVCLGHQVLCDRLGIPLAYKDIVFQGTQSPVDLVRAP